ncbi:uncharacterized protein V1516DRAFT_674733 [Lipomyces oligophaga]|uniref:uncharacterized protein n=1 Tax=Lipomyces oligophaga TaxID=45792 RepID=UPI0034CE6D75
MDRDNVYSIADLVALSKSPLCAPPEGLLSAEEWIPHLKSYVKSRQPLPRRKLELGRSEFHGLDLDPEEKSSHGTDGKFTKGIVLGPPKISFASTLAKKDSDKQQSLELDVSSHRNSGSKVDRSLEGESTSARYSSLTGRSGFGMLQRGEDDNRYLSRASLKAAEIGERRRLRDESGIYREKRTREGHMRRDDDIRGSEKTPEWMLDSPKDSSGDGINMLNGEFSMALGNTKMGSLGLPISGVDLTSGTGGSGSHEHSVEEFEAWKARMKAADMQRKSKTESSRLADLNSTTAELNPAPVIVPFGDRADRFFGNAGSSLSLDDVKEISSTMEAFNLRTSSAEVFRSSKFSSFFRSESGQTPDSESVTELNSSASASRKVEKISQATSPAPVSPSIDMNQQSGESSISSTNGEKEGFKRILALLNSQSIRPPSASSIGSDVPLSQISPEVNSGVFTSPTKSKSPKTEPDRYSGKSSDEAFLRGLMSGSSKTSLFQRSEPSVTNPQTTNIVQEPPSKATSANAIIPDRPMAIPQNVLSHTSVPPGLAVRPHFSDREPEVSTQLHDQGGMPWVRPNPRSVPGGVLPPFMMRTMGPNQILPQLPSHIPAAERRDDPRMISSEGPSLPIAYPARMGMRPIGDVKDGEAGVASIESLQGGLRGGFPPFLPGLMLPSGAVAPPFPPGPLPPDFQFMGMPMPPPNLPPGMNPMIPISDFNNIVPAPSLSSVMDGNNTRSVGLMATSENGFAAYPHHQVMERPDQPTSNL